MTIMCSLWNQPSEPTIYTKNSRSRSPIHMTWTRVVIRKTYRELQIIHYSALVFTAQNRVLEIRKPVYSIVRQEERQR
jgi:hypothetical protein